MIETLRISLHFVVSNSPWTSVTVECMVHEIVRTYKALLNEWRHPLADWMQVVPVIQWAANAAYRERYRACPYKRIFGRESGKPCVMLAE